MPTFYTCADTPTSTDSPVSDPPAQETLTPKNNLSAVENKEEKPFTESSPPIQLEEITPSPPLNIVPDTTETQTPSEQQTPPTSDESQEALPEKTVRSLNAGSIRINEILANPSGPDTGNEFIELYNDSAIAVDLKDWKIYDKTGIASPSKRFTFGNITLAPHDYLTLYNQRDFSFALNNSDEEIFLDNADHILIANYAYTTSHEGLSWNYDDPQWYEESQTPHAKNEENPLTKDYPAITLNELLPDPINNEETDEFIEIYNPFDVSVSLKNWMIKDATATGTYLFGDVVIDAHAYLVVYRSTFGFALNNSGSETVSLITPNNKTISTVSYTQSREELSLNNAPDWYWTEMTPGTSNTPDPRMQTYPQLSLSEISPNPLDNEEMAEFIEIYNPNDSSVDLKNWTLHDASSTGSYTFTKSTIVAARSYYAIYRAQFIFALNNSNETISLVAPNERIISSASYQSSRENLSFNFDLTSQLWRWSKFLTPQKPNIFNNIPIFTKTVMQKIAYTNVYADFSTRATDIDSEKLKVRWDFGDGHRSYIWKTRHKYEVAGTYYGSVRVQDDSEEVVQNFTVIVTKYPKYKLRITKIVPNPAGKDAGNEYLTLYNPTKNSLDLYGWSIATGSTKKTLVNHPITQNVTIKKGDTKMITNTYAAIALPNKTGVIELRRPDGSVSDQISYGDVADAISDNATYELIDNTWQWTIPKDRKKEQQTLAIIMRAISNEQLLTQQTAEQATAYTAIHNPHSDVNSPVHKQTSFLITAFKKINVFLTHGISDINTRVALDLPLLQKAHDLFPSYVLTQDINHCTIPSISPSSVSIYDFCAIAHARSIQ
jgi:hypothetical protein